VPIQDRYKLEMEQKERSRKKLELLVNYENALKDPENANP
jgi:hypothetical protein